MKNAPFISIIMPVYNNERLLPNAINSVISQTFSDWELVIVDDGSTDNTPAVADCFAEKDNRIKVIHQENQWIYKSFNNGIASSSGEYVLVVNSDDTINPESLQRIHDVAVIDNADIVMFNLTISRCDRCQNVLNYDIYGMEKLLQHDFSCCNMETIHKEWITWLKKKLLNHQCVYKSSIAKAIKYRTDIYGGDNYYNIQIADKITAAAGTDYPVYNYYMYPSETMNASVGKYYGYEHNMFNEFYLGYRKLFEDWGIFDDSTADYLASARLNNLTNEIRSFLSPSCPLDTDEKISRIISDSSDRIIYENAVETGRQEEWESRILSGLRELFVKEVPSQESGFLFFYNMLESLLRYEKTEEDRLTILSAVNNPNNPLGIGRGFYNKLSWDIIMPLCHSESD